MSEAGNAPPKSLREAPTNTSSEWESSRESRDIYPLDSIPEKQAVRKLDLTVLPLMTLFYLLSFLDRANIGNARVAGLQTGLHLTDHQYQVAVTVTFVPYIAAELPSNLLLRKIGPSVLMPTLLVIWGVIVTLHGVVTSYAGLVTARAFLGLVEGPMFPGIVLYLSGFYTREELSLRIALFFSAASLSGAFSGLLAAGIQNMDGLGGKPGWAWIFIIEGLFTVVVGLISYFLVPSTPQDSRFLTQTQKDLITRRLARDRPTVAVHEPFSMWEVYRALSSPHVIIAFLMFFGNGLTVYAQALFLPSIVRQLGFSATRTQLLSVPPFAVAFIVSLVGAYFSDHYRTRTAPAVIFGLLSVTGFAIFLAADRVSVAYGSLFLSVPGVYATAPVISAWIANNSEPYYRRATAVAIGFVSTNAGGILATWSFPSNEGPKFERATILNIVFSAGLVLGSLINFAYLTQANNTKRRNRARLLARYTDAEGKVHDRSWVELGDKHPDFRYTI